MPAPWPDDIKRLEYLLRVAWDCGFCAGSMPIFKADDPKQDKAEDVKRILDDELLKKGK